MWRYQAPPHRMSETIAYSRDSKQGWRISVREQRSQGGEVTHSVKEVLPTPIKINKLKLILQGYDVEKLNFFISGFRHGFYLGYQGPRESCFVKTSDSTKDNWEVVNTKSKKEMKMGRIAGLFNMPPFEKFRVSPLAVIPKSTAGEYRLIHNLSAPLGNSVKYQFTS